jgi:hypothetical protein
MFVQSEKFVAEHASATSPHLRPGIELHDVAARQDEFSGRGIDADIRWNNEGSFHKDELKDLRCDYVLANPCPYRKTKTADRNRESADTAPDERSLQVDLVRLDRTVPVAGCVGGGDPGGRHPAASSNGYTGSADLAPVAVAKRIFGEADRFDPTGLS